MLIRHSQLPGLQACPCYTSRESDSEACARGRMIDIAYRARIAGTQCVTSQCSPDDMAAIDWAVKTTEHLADGCEVHTSEDWCRMDTPGLDHLGTCDALCAEQGWLVDLKTGQMRSYYAQVAAYALACMSRYRVDSWIAHILYCDQEEVASYGITRGQAEELLQSVFTEQQHRKPRLCDYCSWCAHNSASQCAAIKGAYDMVAKQAECPIFAQVLDWADCERMDTKLHLGAWVRAWRSVEKQAKKALEKIKALARQDGAMGCKLSRCSYKYITQSDLLAIAEAHNVPIASVLQLYPEQTSWKAAEKWAKSHSIALDESLKTSGPIVERLLTSKEEEEHG